MKEYCFVLLVCLTSMASGQVGLNSRTSIDSLIITKVNLHYPNQFTLNDSVLNTGQVFICDILFSFDQVNILPESLPLLDSIGRKLEQNPKFTYHILQHTDSRGNDEYCIKLSQRRAQMIVDFLLDNYNLQKSQFTALGMGEKDLIFSDQEIDSQSDLKTQEQLHGVNRRSEFKVVQYSE